MASKKGSGAAVVEKESESVVDEVIEDVSELDTSANPTWEDDYKEGRFMDAAVKLRGLEDKGAAEWHKMGYCLWREAVAAIERAHALAPDDEVIRNNLKVIAGK